MDELITKEKQRSYISFSEIHLSHVCPYKWNWRYKEGNVEPHSIFSALGTAIHGAIEDKWKHQIQNSWIKMCKIIILLSKYTDQDHKPWTTSALRIYKDFFPWMDENFGGMELFDIEYKLEEPIPNFSRKFLGYIDLILYDRAKDEYHIFDLKSTSWGWGKKQLTDTHKLYQVILYKKFFCEKNKIDPKKVHCHYLLLLRNPAKNKKYAVDLIDVTSASKKIQNATEWVMDITKKMDSGAKLKSPSTCSFCICEKKKKK